MKKQYLKNLVKNYLQQNGGLLSVIRDKSRRRTKKPLLLP